MILCGELILKALIKSREILDESSRRVIVRYLQTQAASTGGFMNRSGLPDPYYSAFGYALAFAFDIELSWDEQYGFLQRSMESNLDFVHAVSVIRCYLLIAAVEQKRLWGGAQKLLSNRFLLNIGRNKVARQIKSRTDHCFKIIESYESLDKGYHHFRRKAVHGTVYAAFLLKSLFEDLGISSDLDDSWVKSMRALQGNDGSYMNEIGQSGVSPTTAAALILFADRENDRTVNWLKDRWCKSGGFTAAKDVFMPDLLSTATIVLALTFIGRETGSYRRALSGFVDLHWDESGGFFGSAADQNCDCEYTYYALLTLGLINL